MLSELYKHREQGSTSANKQLITPKVEADDTEMNKIQDFVPLLDSENNASLLKKRTQQQVQKDELRIELESLINQEKVKRQKLENMKKFNYTHILMTQKQEFLDISEKLSFLQLDRELGLENLIKNGEETKNDFKPSSTEGKV